MYVVFWHSFFFFLHLFPNGAGAVAGANRRQREQRQWRRLVVGEW
jgi:hypothetical protein